MPQPPRFAPDAITAAVLELVAARFGNYPGALDDSPVNGQDWGDWTGLPILDGTYVLDMHGARSLTVTRAALRSTSSPRRASS